MVEEFKMSRTLEELIEIAKGHSKTLFEETGNNIEMMVVVMLMESFVNNYQRETMSEAKKP